MGAHSTFENPNTDALRSIYENTTTIAVVGASSNPEKAAHTVPEYMQSMGYKIVPVSPRGGELFGEPVARSLADIDVPVDVVQVFRPPEEAAEIARAAALIGAKVLWMQPGVVSHEAASIALAEGMEVAMDICMRATHLLLGLGPRSPASSAS